MLSRSAQGIVRGNARADQIPYLLPTTFCLAGDSSPSQEDSDITKQLIDAGNILGIEIKDHVIVSKTNFFSFKEHKLL